MVNTLRGKKKEKKKTKDYGSPIYLNALHTSVFMEHKKKTFYKIS